MYKTILVHVDDTAQLPGRIAIAATLAERHGAHVVGTAATGISPHHYALVAASPFVPLPIADYADIVAGARSLLERFGELARRRGIESCETRLLEFDVEHALVLQSRYADLVVVSQGAPTAAGTGLVTALPEYVALHGTRPVLVVPGGDQAPDVGRRIAIGWNAGMEASRAIAAALPLLTTASAVQVIVIAPQELAWAHGADPGADIAAYLARHGVAVDVLVERSAQHAGHTLLRCAENFSADLIVAGAYGHSRYREWVAGGVTRTLLEHTRLPLLLAH